jgi:hypothetical protein
MAYIGQGIKEGTFSVLDTSGNTYNGSNVTFSLGTQVGSPAQLLVSHDGVIQKPGTDYTIATGGTQITFTTAPASGASIFITEISGAVGGPLDSDLNGTELILDADADTSITADTDDQIDIKVAGTDQITIKDGALSPVTDNDIDLGTSSLEFKDAYFDGTVTSDGGTFDTLGVGSAKDLGAGIHIKIADTGASANSAADELVIEGTSTVGMSFLTNNDQDSNITFGDSDANERGRIQYAHNGDFLAFHTTGSEQMRIANTGGDLLINRTANNGSYSGKLSVLESSDNISILAENSGTSSIGTSVFKVKSAQDTTNSSYNLMDGHAPSGRFLVRDSGNVQNTNNSYGSISDERVKQNITDANSQWDDIKALKIKKFKLKQEVARQEKLEAGKGETNTSYQIGVVAQELETANMNGLVEESKPEKEDVAYHSDFGTIDGEGNFTAGQKVKSVKYSILYMKAIKALQEAMAKIETLETKVKALEDA